ncbi:MAG: Ketopantoate reductase [Treponematales bacterium]
MRSIQSALIAGAGAVGLTVAEALYGWNPRSVSALAGGERLRRYRERGLWVNGRRLGLDFADAAERNPAPADFIIIAPKAHQLESVIADVRSRVGHDTIILSLMNGISSEDIIGGAFGRERLPLAMIMAIDAMRTGNETTFTNRGVIHFGDADGAHAERDSLIADFFTRGGVPFEYHETDMKRTLWYKFMSNVGVNQTSALLRLPYRAFKKGAPGAVPEALELLESAMLEVIAVANAEGIGLVPEDIESWYKTVAGLNDAGMTSMLQDVLAGRKTEVELFSLTVMERGGKRGIPTPVNATLYRAIRAIERTYPPPA